MVWFGGKGACGFKHNLTCSHGLLSPLPSCSFTIASTMGLGAILRYFYMLEIFIVEV